MAVTQSEVRASSDIRTHLDSRVEACQERTLIDELFLEPAPLPEAVRA
jgi:hypothetical protein